jgi:hypothetical protein
MLERSKALQIYFKPGLKEDDVMLRVWQAAKRNARAQEIFRDMLREGLVALVANGTMPESIIEECGLDAIVERRRRRTAKHSDRQAAGVPQPVPPYGYPAYHPGYPAPGGYPGQELPAYGSHVAHAEIPTIEQSASRTVPPPAAPERPAEQPPAITPVAAAPKRQEHATEADPTGVDDAPRPARKLGKLM